MVSIYGNHYEDLKKVKDKILNDISDIEKDIKKVKGMDPIEHINSRIKSEESMKEKCVRKGLPVNEDSALNKIHDAIGIRVVCAFLDDVYDIKDALIAREDYTVIQEKDYIRNVKPSGYRSYHLILKTDGYYCEIQLRTIAQDSWAALEHHIKYKKHISGDLHLIESELKRCADEMASTDISMQAIRNIILEDNNHENTIS